MRYIENSTDEVDSYTIKLKDATYSNYVINRDHTLTKPIFITKDNTKDSVSIDAHNHTINTNTYFVFDDMGNNFELDNIHFDFNVASPQEADLLVSGHTVTFNHVHIRNMHALSETSYYSGLLLEDVSVFNFTNSSITNYDTALFNYNSLWYYYPELLNSTSADAATVLTVDSCDLDNNGFSIMGTFTGNVVNTSLSSIMTGADATGSTVLNVNDTNDIQDRFVRTVDMVNTHFSNEQAYLSYIDDVLAQSHAGRYLYVITDNHYLVNINVSKALNVDLLKEGKLDFLSYFSDQVDISDFTFTVSDDEVARVENGKVIFLKVGDVDITAVNPHTNEVYTIHFVTEHAINPKTQSSMLILLAILFLVISSLVILYKRKASTI